MDFTEFVNFMNYRENFQATIKDSLLTMNHFFSMFDEFSIETMFKYKKYLLSTNLSSGTINRKIGHINKYACFKNITFEFGAIYKLKYIPYLPQKELITIKEYQKFLKYSLNDNRQIYLIARLFFEAAIRIGSLPSLTYNDIFTKKFITVNIKGTIKHVPLQYDLISKLKIYCVENNISKDIPVFNISRSKIYSDFENICKKARIKKSKFKPHALRSLAIKTLLEDNDIEYVMDYVGHKHLQTTQVYTKRTIKEKRQKAQILENISKAII